MGRSGREGDGDGERTFLGGFWGSDMAAQVDETDNHARVQLETT